MTIEIGRRNLLKLFALTPLVGIVTLPSVAAPVVQVRRAMSIHDHESTILTNKGIEAIIHTMDTGHPLKIDRFAIGTEYGYYPEPQDISVDSMIYAQSGSSIYTSQIDDNTLMFRCSLDTTVGNFAVGNLGLFNGDVMITKTVWRNPSWKYASKPPDVVGNEKVFHIHLSLPGVWHE